MADFGDSVWQRKGATLSDKTAREEYGLSQNEIVEAIRDGELQHRENSVHGNPFLRLLRHEIEALIEKKHGAAYLHDRQVKKELRGVNSDLTKLKKQLDALEERKSQLLADLTKQR